MALQYEWTSLEDKERFKDELAKQGTHSIIHQDYAIYDARGNKTSDTDGTTGTIFYEETEIAVLTDEEKRVEELTDKVEREDLSVEEINELIRLGEI